MTELHLYFAQCLKTLSGEFSAGLTTLQTQFEKLLSEWEATAGETQRSMQSLEQRVASLERKSQQDPPEDPKP
jgi:hypothetical protein